VRSTIRRFWKWGGIRKLSIACTSAACLLVARAARDILLETLNKHVAVKRVVKNGDGRVEVAYDPVVLDEMTLRALLIGRLPPAGGNMPRELPGGPLASRMPKA
jgi:hypothetical protein